MFLYGWSVLGLRFGLFVLGRFYPMEFFVIRVESDSPLMVWRKIIPQPGWGLNSGPPGWQSEIFANSASLAHTNRGASLHVQDKNDIQLLEKTSTN